MAVPDALSRLYENEKKGTQMDDREVQRIEKGKKIKEGKWNKHVINNNGQEVWQFDD